jgi:hypothetical protein
MTPQTGRTLAQIGFLLILFAGVWLAAAQIPLFKMATARTIVAGIALAIAGVLSSSPRAGVISARRAECRAVATLSLRAVAVA